jgi:hypothetical protein
MKSKSGFIDPANIKSLLDMAGQTIQLCQITETQGDPMLGIPSSVTESCRQVSGWIQPMNDFLLTAIEGINGESINRSSDGNLKGYLLASDLKDYQWQPDVFIRFQSKIYHISSRQLIRIGGSDETPTDLVIEIVLTTKKE